MRATHYGVDGELFLEDLGSVFVPIVRLRANAYVSKIALGQAHTPTKDQASIRTSYVNEHVERSVPKALCSVHHRLLVGKIDLEDI